MHFYHSHSIIIIIFICSFKLNQLLIFYVSVFAILWNPSSCGSLVDPPLRTSAQLSDYTIGYYRCVSIRIQKYSSTPKQRMTEVCIDYWRLYVDDARMNCRWTCRQAARLELSKR